MLRFIAIALAFATIAATALPANAGDTFVRKYYDQPSVSFSLHLNVGPQYERPYRPRVLHRYGAPRVIVVEPAPVIVHRAPRVYIEQPRVYERRTIRCGGHDHWRVHKRCPLGTSYDTWEER